jgi:type I restriction enzyme, S subunit
MKYRIREQNELKPSGVEWLGDIYKNWGVISIKRLIQILTDYTANGSFADLAKNVTYLDEPDFARLIRLTDIRKNFKNDTGVYINKDSYDFLKKSSLFGNEILIANVGAYSGYSFLLPEKLDFKASLAPNMFLIKFKENKVLHKFIFYVLKSNIVLDKLIQLSISAAQPKLNKDNIKSLVIPFLSLVEQQKIANFLDEKSKIFDEAISKKEQLISKLELAKQSLISEVVTGKLKIIENNSKLQTIKREENELKPSRVEWFENIPKEWEVKKLGYIFSFKNGVNTDSSNYGKGIKFINVKETINTNFIMENDIEGSVTVSDSIIKENSVKKGDVLFNRTSETIEELALSTVYYDDKIALFGGFVIRGRQITKDLDLDFKRYCFQSTEMRKQIISYGSGSIRKNIAQTNLKNVYLFVPTITEQQKISKYLDEKLIHFDNTIEKTKQSIKKLKEAKESLISQAVTGKIEVL